MCPLPMFHVFAAYPILMSCLMTGAQMVMPTPQGYRGEGVMDNFWKLIERHKVTFLITVPTAVAALMQRKVDADVSTLQLAISGSAAMPVELFHRFEEATGVKVMEGYGMTEATCLVSINPPYGERKIGSVGLPFPYTDVRDPALRRRPARCRRNARTDEVGEICVRNPGVGAEIYTDPARNRGVIAEGGYLRTGDLGRIDADGYIWITGRAKDLIIRGGHNIDPALIEDALMQHPAGGLRRRDRPAGRACGRAAGRLCRAGRGRQRDGGGAARACARHIPEPAAVPKHVEVVGRAAEDRGRQGLQARPAAAGDRAGLRRGAGRGRVGGAGGGGGRGRRLGLVAEIGPGPGGRGRDGRARARAVLRCHGDGAKDPDERRRWIQTRGTLHVSPATGGLLTAAKGNERRFPDRLAQSIVEDP